MIKDFYWADKWWETSGRGEELALVRAIQADALRWALDFTGLDSASEKHEQIKDKLRELEAANDSR